MQNKDKLKRIGEEVHLAIMDNKKPKLSAAKKIVDILMKVTYKKFILLAILIASLTTTEISAQNFYKQLDSIRSENNLAPLKRSISLQIASYRWARKCVNKYNIHLMHDKNAGKEVVALYGDPINQWMNSPPHRGMLLRKNIKKVGYGQYRGYYVARFR